MSKRKDISKITQKKLFQEANSQCMFCGNDDVSVLHIHHIIPVSESPEHDIADMIVLCANCHARADRGQIPRDSLYAAKKRRSNIIPFPQGKSSKGEISVVGNGNVTAGRDIHITGGLNIKYPKSRGKSRQAALVVPGTVAEDARMYNYLNYLIERYNEFKKWECDKKNLPMKYPLIRVSYQRYMKCKVKDTPRDQFDKGVAYLQKRISNTMLGRNKKSKGQQLFSPFETFDQDKNGGPQPAPV